jgi:hypothetical protein
MHRDDRDAAIVISRRHGGYRDWFRSYAIMLDRQLAGTIKRGQRVELPVSHSRHELFLKIDWCKSRSITFDAQPGAVIEFFCEPGGPAFAGLQAVFGSGGQYITLTCADSHVLLAEEDGIAAVDPKVGEGREEPTAAEAEFTQLLDSLSGLNIQQIGLATDDRGPWMLVALRFDRDIGGEDVIFKSLRLDFDAAGVRGGWSRYGLNGDEDFRAEDADVDTAPPNGISMSAADYTMPELAQAAADWFQRHWDEWEIVRNHPPERTSWLGRLLGQPEWRYPC